MKKIIKQVTVTGADDSVSIADLRKIQAEYPFVEWGILLSKTSEGRSRFPSQDWTQQLVAYKDELNLSGHLCGKWVRDICGGSNSVYEDRPWFSGLFGRYQLNFHADRHLIQNELEFISAIRWLSVRQVILQFDEVNNNILQVIRANHIDAVPLFDTSGGAGILPAEWPEAMECYSGYAGGLSPENVDGQMKNIEGVCGDGPIWIDAETWLRSYDDRQFDLNKVRRFLDAAKPWVIGT